MRRDLRQIEFDARRVSGIGVGQRRIGFELRENRLRRDAAFAELPSASRRERSYAKVVASGGNQPTSVPHSVVMLAMERRSSMESDATPGPVNSTTAFSTSSLL